MIAACIRDPRSSLLWPVCKPWIVAPTSGDNFRQHLAKVKYFFRSAQQTRKSVSFRPCGPPDCNAPLRRFEAALAACYSNERSVSTPPLSGSSLVSVENVTSRQSLADELYSVKSWCVLQRSLKRLQRAEYEMCSDRLSPCSARSGHVAQVIRRILPSSLEDTGRLGQGKCSRCARSSRISICEHQPYELILNSQGCCYFVAEIGSG